MLLINLAAAHNWEIHHLDLKTAFLHGDLKDTVYVTQPEGFEVVGSESKVYKLNKAFYGLRQAPRAWNHKLNSILKELLFVKCSKEPSVYLRKIQGDLLFVAVYVDDLFITETNVQHINDFKREMSAEFEMSDLGRLNHFLGIEVIQHLGGITLSQKNYALKILEEDGMKNCMHTPMDFGLKLSKSGDEKSI